MEAKATLKHARISPRKVKIVLDLIRGKDAGTAMAILNSTKKSASEYLVKLLGSAIANATNNFNMDETSHIILLAVTYLLFSIFFSLNDIAYWSLMPAISKDQTVREGVGAFARICANIGMFAMVLIYLNVPSVFSFLGNTDRDIYFGFAIIISIIMRMLHII